MAALPVATRTRLWIGLMRWWSQHEHAIEQPFAGPAKFDIYNPTANTGLITQIDDWVDTHSANTCNTIGLNGAIEEPCKSGLTASTKGFVTSMIILARYNPELCKSVLGGMD